MRIVIYLAMAVLLVAPAAWAKPTTPQQARNVVLNWLRQDAAPLGAPLGRQIKNVQTFTDGAGEPAYYVVYLNPAGLVLVPADDLVEPIIGFLSEGAFDPSPANPLGALVSRDIPGRVLKAREVKAASLEKGVALGHNTPQAKARRKWAWLANGAADKAAADQAAREFWTPSISDVRVPSFVPTRWNQAGADGSVPDPICTYPCYNYFTPPNSVPPSEGGDAGNYVCGCVATAMAQLLRHWSYPTSGIGVRTFDYKVSNVPKSGTTRGGDNSGGAYVWSDMPYTTGPATTLTQRAAIGRLTWDAGLSVNMNYDTVAAGGSGADTLLAAAAFVNTFQYSNARKGYNDENNLPDTNRNNMVNPNLHAGYPVLFGIWGEGSAGGHAIVCDGYGYNVGSTMYHHLNMGWSGADDAWYNLPNVDAPSGTWTSVTKCVYNVYTSGTGEIIAGRVTKADGVTPLSGAAVSATGGHSATTDARGIYALAKVPSASNYSVKVTKPGYIFASRQVSTGTSTDNTTTTGNVWGVDFKTTIGSTVAVIELLLLR